MLGESRHQGALTFGELVLQLSVPDGFRRLTHLPQQLLQAPHAADDAAWTERGHARQGEAATAGQGGGQAEGVGPGWQDTPVPGCPVVPGSSLTTSMGPKVPPIAAFSAAHPLADTVLVGDGPHVRVHLVTDMWAHVCEGQPFWNKPPFSPRMERHTLPQQHPPSSFPAPRVPPTGHALAPTRDSNGLTEVSISNVRSSSIGAGRPTLCGGGSAAHTGLSNSSNK